MREGRDGATTDRIALVTDHESTEDSRSCLAAAVEQLTGRPPLSVDARCLMGATEHDMLRRFGDRLPAVVILYEIPPHERPGIEAFQLLLRERGVRTLGADVEAWRAATDKALTVERFRRDGIPHAETVTLSAPHQDEYRDAFERLGRDVWTRPTVGMGGADVVHITDHDRLAAAARYYAASGRDWQLCRDAGNVTGNGLRRQFRVTVLHGAVIQACENIQVHPDEPCNVSRGAVSTVVDVDDLPADVNQLAVSATKSLGLTFGGVDLCVEGGGAVFEVNVHPAMNGPQRPMEMAIPYVAAHLGPR